MTQTKWEHIGGLPGLSLTVQDAGVPELTLHGPPGLVSDKSNELQCRIIKLLPLLGWILQCHATIRDLAEPARERRDDQRERVL